MADDEAQILDALQQRLGRKGVIRNKSEVLRAAIRTLKQQSDEDLVEAAQAISQFKRGRKPHG